MSAFCPNLSNKRVRSEFESLKSQVGTDLAYYLWDKYEGDLEQIYVEAQQLQEQLQNEFKDKSKTLQLKPGDVVFGHPAIGKTYSVEHGKHAGEFIDWDVEYNRKRDAWIEEHSNTRKGTPEYKKARNEYLIYPEKHPDYMEFLTNEWERVKEKAKRENKILIASPHTLLKHFTDDFDYIINLDESDFIERNMGRGGDEQGSILWKQGIDETISKIQNKPIFTLKKGEYFEDLLNRPIIEDGIKNKVSFVNNRRQNFTPEEFALSQRMSFVLRNLFPEIDVQFVDSIEGGYVGESDLNALKILLDRILESIDTEPHEYAHFYIAMFRNSKLVQKGIEMFGSEEALVQAIGVRTVEMEAKARTWWQKFISFIKKTLNKNKYAKQALLEEITDAFLTRSDLGEGVSIYDLTGIEHQEQQQSIAQVRAILQKVNSELSFDPVSHNYYVKATNKKLKSVSTFKEEYKYGTYDAANEDDIQMAISDEARTNGTSIHAVFESMFNGTFKPSNFADNYDVEVLKQMFDIVQKLKSKYDWVASEAMLYDESIGMAGTADLIVRDRATGEYVLLDFKTKMTKYNNTTKNKKGKTLYGFRYVTSKFFSLLSQRDGYDFQISCYAKMLEKKGIKIARKGIIPITYEYNNNKISAVYLSKYFGKETTDKESNEFLSSDGYFPINTPPNIKYDVDNRVFGEQSDDVTTIMRGKMIEELRDITQQVTDRLHISSDILKAKGFRTLSNDAKYLLEQMDELQELNALFKYINFGVDQLSRINKSIQRFYAKGPDAQWSLDALTQYKDVATSYQLISKIQGIVDRYESLLDKNDVRNIRIACNKLADLQRSIMATYDSIGAEIYLDNVTPNIKNIENDYRNKYAKEFDEANKKEAGETDKQYKQRKQKYVDEKVEENKDIIQYETRRWLKAQTETADSGFECSSIFALVNSVYENNQDPFVQSMVIQFDDVMMKNNQKMLRFKAKLQKLLKEYRQKYPFGNFSTLKDVFDDMIEYTESGQCYLVNPQSGEFIEAQKKAFSDIRNNPNLDYNEKVEARKRWLDENCPILDLAAYQEERNSLYNQWFADIEDAESRKKQLAALEKNDKAEKKMTLGQMAAKGLITIETRNFLQELDTDLEKKYRRPNPSKFKNEKYKKLLELKESDDPKWKLYKLFLDITEEMDTYMDGPAMSLCLNYRLPGIIRRGMECVNQDGTVSGIKQSFKKDILRNQDDDIRGSFVNENGERISQVPHFFYRGVTEEEQSFDLPTIFFKWYDSANTWVAKKSIESMVRQTQAILHSRNTEESNKFSLLDKVRKRRVKSHKKNTAALVDSWVDIVFYGNTMEDYGTIKIPFTDKEIDVAKLIKAIVSFASKRTMFGNSVSAINNVLVGEVNQAEEAFAGKFMSVRAYTKASKIFALHMKDMIEDFNNPVPKDKLNRLAEYFGIFEANRNQSLTGFMRHSLEDYGYMGNKTGERIMQTRFLAGMLCEEQAKDKDGNILGDMLDFIDVNDDMELVVDPRVANFNDTQVNRFSLKTRKILMLMHGNYSQLSAVAMSSKWYGFIGLALRKWIAPSVLRRFGSHYFDNVTGTEGEGFYRTGSKWYLYQNPFSDAVMSFIAHNIIKTEKYKSQALRWNELEDWQKQNIIRFTVEIAAAALAYSIYVLLGSVDGEDDNGALSMFRYQSYRIFTDLTFFFLPSSFAKILQDPFPAMGLMTDVTKLFQQVFDPFEEYQGGNHMFDNKLLNQIFKLTPGLKQVGRLQNIESEMEYFIRRQ